MIARDATQRAHFAKVFLKVVRERALGSFELWGAKAQTRVLVFAHLFKLFGVLAHLLQQIHLVLVVGIDAFFEIFKFAAVLLCFGVW